MATLGVVKLDVPRWPLTVCLDTVTMSVSNFMVSRLHTFSTRCAHRPNALSLPTHQLRCPKFTVYRIQSYRGLIGTTSSPKDASPKNADPSLIDATEKPSSEKASSQALIKVKDVPAPHVGRIRVITLSSPRNKNAISRQLLKELHAQVSNIRYQSHVESKAWATKEHAVSMGQGIRGVVIGSEVDGAFCAGADLKERAGMSLDEYVSATSYLNGPCVDHRSRVRMESSNYNPYLGSC